MTLPLSPRESEVFALIGLGLSSKEIGAQLGTSRKTVDAQKNAIKLKLGCKNFRELMVAAVKASSQPTPADA
jgi:DNA-binding CsgD family transcriptional regulator